MTQANVTDPTPQNGVLTVPRSNVRVARSARTQAGIRTASALFLCPSLFTTGSESLAVARSIADQIHTKSESDCLFVIVPREAIEAVRGMPGIEILVYDNEFDFEYSYGVWGRLRDRSFDAVVVFGRETTEDKHELLAANFLSAKERSYLKADGSQEDISSWRDHVVMNTEPGPVRIRRLAESDGAAYRQRVNKWAAETVAKTNFNVVEGKRDRIGNLSGYSSVPMLANDLGMQTPHLHRDQFGVSWGHFMLPNGQFCVTPDYHRAIANYVNAIPDVRSVIDVGCGSGFAPFHLANNPRYDRVVGVDGAGPRATSA